MDAALDKRQLLSELQARMFGVEDPVHVGRYVLQHRLGSGAMGVVYEAFDPGLRRPVALKVLHPERLGEDAEVARARVIREAQALARLEHPNVVQVFDVGRHGDQIFIAMELVRGQPLDAWLRAEPRSWTDVLRVFVDAGRGLGAAHEVGIVHRDFKPANVLVADDRVRVLDFGLARLATDGGFVTDRDDPTPLGTGSPVLTADGAIPGTPLYVAPEVMRREPATPRSDQYAFFVALYEAIYGCRPFDGARMFLDKDEGRIAEPRNRRGVPAWLDAAVRRGLAPRPEDRFPDMVAVLGVLQRSPRTRWPFVVGALAVAVAGTASLFVGDEADRCAGVGGQVREVWGPERAATLAASFAEATEADRGTWPRVRAQLDAYAASWAEALESNCRAAATDEPALVDRRARCLQRRGAELRALVDVLVRGGPRLTHAVSAVDGLRPVDACGDERALAVSYDPPRGDVDPARLEQTRESLDRVQALLATRDHEAVLETAELAAAQAEAIGDEPLHAEALYALGRAQSRAGDNAAADTLGRAVSVAARARHEEVEALARGWRLRALVRRGDLETMRQEVEPALAAVRRTGDERLLAGVLTWSGDALRVAGDLDGADARLQEARGLVERMEDAPLLTADVLTALGSLQATRGELEEAVRLTEEGRALFERELGPGHRRMITALSHLAAFEGDRQNYAAAEHWYAETLAVLRAYLPEQHGEIADVLTNEGGLFFHQERYDEALDNVRQAVAIYEAVHGPTHPDIAWAKGLQASIFAAMERYDEAVAAARASVEMERATLDPADPRIADGLAVLAAVSAAAGRLEDAALHWAECLRLREHALGADHPHVALAHLGLADARADQGRDAEARAHAKAALAIARARGLTPMAEAAEAFLAH